MPFGTPTLAGVDRGPDAVLPEFGALVVRVLAGFELAGAEADADADAEGAADAEALAEGAVLPWVLPWPDWWPDVVVALQLASISDAAATAMSAVAAPS